MFKYTSTTILNSDTDKQSGKPMFSSIEAQGLHGPILKIKRDYTFEMPGIVKVYKKVAAEPTFAELTIDCDKLISELPSDLLYPASGRISLYIAMEGSEESIFANDFYQKGHPFSIGFLVKDTDMTGSELAEQLCFNVTRFDLGDIGRPVFTATADGSVVTLKCTDEFERFKGIVALLDLGVVEKEIAHYFDPDLANDQDIFAVTSRGKAGFGTFRHLMKDLRLPTAANTGWLALYKSDKPIPGALYNQYIIYYEAPSGTNPSYVAVGHATVSQTAHIFWVNQDYDAAFQDVLVQVVGDPAENDPTSIFEIVTLDD